MRNSHFNRELPRGFEPSVKAVEGQDYIYQGCYIYAGTESLWYSASTSTVMTVEVRTVGGGLVSPEAGVAILLGGADVQEDPTACGSSGTKLRVVQTETSTRSMFTSGLQELLGVGSG